MKIRRAGIIAPHGRAATLTPVFPNEGVSSWYYGHLDRLIREMYIDVRMTLIPILTRTPPVVIISRDESIEVEPNAAGIMFWCRDRFLVLERSDGSGWGLPGGGIERGETAEQAACRETLEECGFRGLTMTLGMPLTVRTVHRFYSAVYVTFENFGSGYEWTPMLNREHSAFAWRTIDEALQMNLHPGLRASIAHTLPDPFAAMDASPTKEMQFALRRSGEKWKKRFDKMSLSISLDFAARNQRATETAMKAALKKGGFTVEFKPTKASVTAYKTVAAEQVGLIRSIPERFHTDVQTHVWESVRRGADMRTLSKKLEKTYGVTARRAALIARDQNAKAKAVMEAVRLQQIGVRQAIWMHSAAGKEPRPTHVAMNGKLYDLAKGLYDSDERKFVHPGELINCRCSMRPYIPGFEGVAPDVGVIQT